MNKSSTDIAYELLKENKGGLPFSTIWEKIVSEKGYDLEKQEDLISSFYTDVVLDGRFITHGENVWDLREDNPSSKFHIDMNDVYASDDDDIIEDEDGVIAKEDLLIDNDDDEMDIDSNENLEDELEIVQDIDETN